MGLAISKHLAELMGGQVGCQREVGKGSTFWFTARFELGPEAQAPLPSDQLSGLRVLVVDDNPTARLLLTTLLRRMKCDVAEADGGASALLALQSADDRMQPFKIVLLDWMMPGSDGIEVAHQIAALALRQRPYCILVTGNESEELATLARAAGFLDLLVKPVVESQLVAAITKAVGPAGQGEAVKPAEERLPARDGVAGARVLLVEDDDLSREVAQTFLQDEGLVVDLAPNGAVAVDMVQRQPYAMVFMDMQMPVMDGLTASRQIRALPNKALLPIVAMTANALPQDREQCLQAGMNDHIGKPLDPQLLRVKLQQWLPAGVEAPKSAKVPEPLPLQTSPGLPVVDGLDTLAGLRQVGGNPVLYENLLHRFTAGQAQVILRLNESLQAANWAEAERLAHTLKGSAAQIGARTVSQLAEKLETACRTPGQTAGQEPLLQALSAALQPLLRGLQAWAQAHPQAVVAESDDVVDWPQLKAQLLALLADDNASSTFLFERHEPLLRAHLGGRVQCRQKGDGSLRF